MKVELGNSIITVGEMLALSRGDVIVLDKKVSQNLTVKVDDYVKFLGLPGKKNNNLAVRITDVIEEGEDLDG